jgi:acetyl/propionyl-CoA carboxylase alpha subunit/acetyl-CoA carboxylase carboxyltransferase component
MKRLLIANRGEIALRIARTARELGIATLAVASADDEALSGGYGCDDCVRLPGRGAASYLDVEALLEIARRHDCDAVHPGYGFLSESSDFARACHDAKLLFIGPSSDTLALFGNKARARAHAETHAVPILPGIDAAETAAEIRRFLEAQPPGDAIVLKAAAGGGGRGMRVIRSPAEVDAAFARCQSEALRSFGSDALFAERWLESTRHIEIQIVADDHGATSHLWERDCTLQRRHQKVVEIAPAPDLDAALRETLLDAAQRLARAANYRGVGTFEFLVAPSGEFYFMEANPRLQVEHTISEEITGIDLVEVQLRVARGETLEQLGLATPPTPRGHAIQFRVLAETLDDEGSARPTSGVLERFELPSGPGLRVDTAMRRGLAPHPAFDPLLAKIIVTSPQADRQRLVDRARRALAESRIEGLDTNLPFLRALVERPEFLRSAFDTRFIEDHAAELNRNAEAFANDLGADAGSMPSSERSSVATASAAASSSTLPNSWTRASASLAPPDGVEAVVAPLLGTVIEIGAAEGDRVVAGQSLCVLEAMKMEHLVVAPCSGRVDSIRVATGDVIAEDTPLVWIAPAEHQDRAASDAQEMDLERIRPDLADVKARLALLEDASRPQAVARRRSRGQRTARENLAALCDPDSFLEYGGLAVAAQRRARPIEELRERTPADAIVTGLATINADRFGEDAARCAVLVVDATVLAGTQGFFHHHKIDRILDLAERANAPVVFFPEGGGGRPNDTDVGDISAAGLTVTSFHAFARLSGKVPRVSVVSGFCFAGSAAFAGCADVIIATRNTSLGMGGPAMIEGGGLGVHAPEDVGPVSVQEPNGVIDLLVEDEVEAVEAARRYLAYFQGSIEGWECGDQRRLRHLIPENRRRVYDVRAVIEALCDVGSVLELRRAFGVGMITALVRIEGRAFGLIANDPMHLGGAIDDVGSDKAARFLQLCDAFGLPIVSLCDTPGFMVGPEIEERAQVRKVSRLFVTGASLGVPLFTVILRKGYGLGAQAMAGGSFLAPVFTLAWPTGEIGGMGLEGAVDLGFKKTLDALEDPAERTALRDKLIAVMYEKGKALNAASQLEFDGVIDPAETRATILRGLTSFGPIPRSHRMIDTW